MGITPSSCVLSDCNLQISATLPFVNTYLTDDKTAFRTVFICTTFNTLPLVTELTLG